MFRVFSRNTTSGDVTGTGLGLAIVREIAKKHSGNAWASSTLGQGATFYFSIAKNLKEFSGFIDTQNSTTIIDRDLKNLATV